MSAKLEIGSENENGEHIRGQLGWPYSIYLPRNDIGDCDRVLCHGIQSLKDAQKLLSLIGSETFRITHGRSA